MHPRIAARRRELTQAKLNFIATQMEDVARSLLALASKDCCTEVAELAAVYRVIGTSLRSRRADETELGPLLKHLRLAISDLTQTLTTSHHHQAWAGPPFSASAPR
jgi:hypothetical protein